MARYSTSNDSQASRDVNPQRVPRPDRFSDSYVEETGTMLAQADGRIQFDPNDPPDGLRETQDFYEAQKNCRSMPD